MRRILHILTAEDRPFSSELIQHQAASPHCDVETFDLNQVQPNYDALLDKIFSADSVAVW
jgi:hypothetical protein